MVMSKMVTRSGLVLGLLGLMGFQRCSASRGQELALKLERLEKSGGHESDNASENSDTSNGATDEDESGLLNLGDPKNEEKSDETVTHTLQTLKAFIQPNPQVDWILASTPRATKLAGRQGVIDLQTNEFQDKHSAPVELGFISFEMRPYGNPGQTEMWIPSLYNNTVSDSKNPEVRKILNLAGDTQVKGIGSTLIAAACNLVCNAKYDAPFCDSLQRIILQAEHNPSPAGFYYNMGFKFVIPELQKQAEKCKLESRAALREFCAGQIGVEMYLDRPAILDILKRYQWRTQEHSDGYSHETMDTSMGIQYDIKYSKQMCAIVPRPKSRHGHSSKFHKRIVKSFEHSAMMDTEE